MENVELIIKEILESKDVFELKNNVKKFLKAVCKLGRNKKYYLTILASNLKQLMMNYKIKHEENNITIFDKDIAPIMLLANEIINYEQERNIEEILEDFIKKVSNEYKKDAHTNNEISKEDIIHLLDLADKKYDIKKLLQIANKTLDIMILDVKHTQYNGDFVSYNTIVNNAYAIRMYECRKECNPCYVFMYQIGNLINTIAVGDSKIIPDSFMELSEKLGADLEYENEENAVVFADMFATSTLNNTEFSKYIPFDFPQDFIEIFEKYYNKFCKDLYVKFEDRKNLDLIDDKILCPCGSGKRYDRCCKVKGIKYYNEDENGVSKVINMSNTMANIMQQTNMDFKEMFGRTKGEEEYLIDGVTGNDFKKIERILRKVFKDDKSKVYAYVKTGILLTENNMHNVSDKDIEEWGKAVQEYEDLINERSENEDRVNIIQAVEMGDTLLEGLCKDYIPQLIYTLNMFIRKATDTFELDTNFRINKLEDFLSFCAYKTVRNLEAVNVLLEEEQYEHIMSTARFIYEILLNVKVYISDTELFKKKIWPLAGIDKGTHYKILKDINGKKVERIVDKETKKEYNCNISIREMARRAGDSYVQIYKTWYDEMSGFIHVDTLAIKRIFAENDLFYELDECYIAGLLAILFSAEIIEELSKLEGIQPQLKRDLKYMSSKILKEIQVVLPFIKDIEENNIYEILEDNIKEVLKS